MNPINERENNEEKVPVIPPIEVLETICDLIKVGLESNQKVKKKGYWQTFLSNKRMKKHLGNLSVESLRKYTTMITKVSFDDFDKIVRDFFQVLKASKLHVKNLIELITCFLKLEEKPVFQDFLHSKKMKKKKLSE